MVGTILIILYVIACMFLILVVLLQAGKGGGLGTAFGGAAGAVFSGRGAATFLTKLTGVMAALFMILAVGISLHMTGDRSSVSPDTNIEEEKDEEVEDLSKIGSEEPEKAPAEKPAGETAPAAGEKPSAEPAPAEDEPAAEPAPAEEKPAAEPAPAEEKPAAEPAPAGE